MDQECVPGYLVEAFHDVKAQGGCCANDTRAVVVKMQEFHHDEAVEWLLSDESPTGVDLERFWALIVRDGTD